MQSFSYFPTSICRDEKPELAHEVLSLYEEVVDPLRDENPYFVQSEDLTAHTGVQNLRSYLLESARYILRSQGYSVEKYDFFLSGLWAQEITQGSGTNSHIHKNSQLSGWLFLDVGKQSAFPVYHDTRINKNMVELDYVEGEEISFATSAVHFKNIAAGTVLFNNAWVPHELRPGKGKPTKCIHFIISHKDKACSIS